MTSIEQYFPTALTKRNFDRLISRCFSHSPVQHTTDWLLDHISPQYQQETVNFQNLPIHTSLQIGQYETWFYSSALNNDIQASNDTFWPHRQGLCNQGFV